MEKVNTFLVPVDYGENTEDIVRYAVNLARSLSGEIVLLHVVQPPVVSIGPEPAGLSAGHDLLNQTMLDNASQYVTELQPLLEGLAHRSLIRVGHAAAEIVAVAKQVEATMIVMSTHGRNVLSRLLLGSTTEAVMRYAPVPVLTVRAALFVSDKTAPVLVGQ